MLTYILKVKVKNVFFYLLFLFSCFYVVKNYFFHSSTHDSIPILLWWTPFIENKRVINCDNKFMCLLSSNRTLNNHTKLGAYLFYGSRFNPHDVPVNKGIPWAIFHEESPKNLALFLYKDAQALFNLTSTFDRRSDFPLTLQYLKDISSLTDLQYYIPTKEKNSFSGQLAPVLYVQSDCNTPIERDAIVSEFMKYIDVDSYGSCLNNKKLPQCLHDEDVIANEYHVEMMKFVAKYKFVLSIENAVCDDYITEKLWRPLMVGSVPIYLGSSTVRDWLPNNNSAILIKEFKSIKSLVNYVKRVNQNDHIYESYLDHKLKPIASKKITNQRLRDALSRGDYGIENNQDFTIPAFECFVCKKIYQKDFRSRTDTVYNCLEPESRVEKNDNWWKYHWRLGKCQAKALKELVEKGRNYTKEVYNEKVQYYYNKKLC